MSIWRAEGSRSRNAANCSPAARGGRSTSTRGSRCTVSWQRPNSSLGGIDGRRRFPGQQKGPAVSSQALGVIGGANRDRTGDLYNAIVMVLGFLSFPQISDLYQTLCFTYDYVRSELLRLAVNFRALLPPCFPGIWGRKFARVIMAKLTKRVVDAICPDPTGRDTFAWDAGDGAI